MHVLALEQSTTIQYALGAESAATYKEKHWRLNSAQELMNKVGLLQSFFYNGTSISFCQNSL